MELLNRCLAAATLLAASGISLEAQILAEGGFENPVLSDAVAYSTVTAGVPNPQLAGSPWTFVGQAGMAQNSVLFPPMEGNQAAFLQIYTGNVNLTGGNGPGGSVEQTFTGMVGQNYNLDFDYSGYVNGTLFFTVNVFGDGAPIPLFTQVVVGQPDQVLHFQGTFNSGTATSLRLEFATTLGLDPDNNAVFFDNVIVAVPEPATVLGGLFAVGLGAVAFRRRLQARRNP